MEATYLELRKEKKELKKENRRNWWKNQITWGLCRIRGGHFLWNRQDRSIMIEECQKCKKVIGILNLTPYM